MRCVPSIKLISRGGESGGFCGGGGRRGCGESSGVSEIGGEGEADGGTGRRALTRNCMYGLNGCSPVASLA